MQITSRIKLPADTATQKIAMLGRTGSGKSYAAKKLVELLLEAGFQVVILDPVGIWWGLRLMKDGKTPSPFKLPVIGGLHGDVPLEVGAGAMLADVVVDRTASMVIDVSMFESDADKTRFATAFADRFFFRKKSSPSPVCLVMDECQEFIPQNTQRGEERMLHAFTRIWKLGRNFGIGGVLISQRPQEINKKALNQTECLFAFQTTGIHERKAIEEWIKDKALDLNVASDLPKLQQGNAHLWSPQWLKVSEVVKVLEIKTFDSSSTPITRKATKVKELAPIDLKALKEQMAATIEKANAENPTLLKKHIAELERKLANASKNAIPSSDVLAAARRGIEKAYSDEIKQRDDLIRQKNNVLNKIAALVHEHPITEVPALQKTVGLPDFKNPPPPPPRPHPAAKKQTAQSDLGKCETAILKALAQFNGGVTKSKLGILTGYSSTSGGFNGALGKLRAAQLIDGSSDAIQITDDGLQNVGDFDPLPTGRALHEFWYNKLPKAQAQILRVLIEHHGRPMDKSRLGELTEYSPTSGGFNGALGKLRTLELITGGSNAIKASDDLF